MEQASQILSCRKATLNDLEPLLQLGLDAYEVYKDTLPAASWRELRTKLEDITALEKLMQIATVFVCEAAGRLAGKAFLVPQGNPTAIYPAEWAYIRKLGVHPDYTGRGIATALTRLCMDEAAAQGAHTIALHTAEIMHAARHIYESLGFMMQKEIPPQFGVRYFLYALPLC